MRPDKMKQKTIEILSVVKYCLLNMFFFRRSRRHLVNAVARVRIVKLKFTRTVRSSSCTDSLSPSIDSPPMMSNLLTSQVDNIYNGSLFFSFVTRNVIQDRKTDQESDQS